MSDCDSPISSDACSANFESVASGSVAKLCALMQLARLDGCAMVVGLYCVSRVFAPEAETLDPRQLILPAASLTLVVAGGFALNDYTDRDADEQVHPERVLPRRRLAPEHVLYVGALQLCIAALVLAALGPWHLLFGLVAIALVILYAPLKHVHGVLGNVALSVMMVWSVIYGQVTAGPVYLSNELVLLSAVTCCAALAREILKDIEDMSFERYWRSTLPIAIGATHAYRVSAALLALSTVILCVLFALLASPAALVLGLPIVVGGAVTAHSLLHADVEAASGFILGIKRGAAYTILVLLVIGLL